MDIIRNKAMKYWWLTLSIFYHFYSTQAQWWIYSRVLSEQQKFVSREQEMCYNFNLNDAQIEHCLKQPRLLLVVGRGTRDGLSECQHQFQQKRWNCSSDGANKKLYKRRTPETAFVNAISSAAVAYRISEECDSGRLSGCGCVKVEDPERSLNMDDPEKPFYWTSCKDHIKYGMRTTRVFLDPSKEELFVDKGAKSLKKLVIAHNNKAARKIMNKMAKDSRKCTCKGPTGQCLVKTCYRWLPPIRTIGHELHKKYQDALKVRLHEQRKLTSDEGKRELQRTDLVYTERLNYCEVMTTLGIPGTQGRVCNDTEPRFSDDMTSCKILCCGRGYNPVQRKVRQRCGCTFKWCCEVSCKWCERIITEHQCK